MWLTINLGADSAYPPPTTKQLNCDGTSLTDGLNSLFSVYTGRATEEDQKMAGSWMSVADGVLVMVRYHLPPSPFFDSSYFDPPIVELSILNCSGNITRKAISGSAAKLSKRLHLLPRPLLSAQCQPE